VQDPRVAEGFELGNCVTALLDSSCVSGHGFGTPNKRRIADDEKYVHFVTFSCDHRRRLLEEDHPKRILLRILNHQLDRLQTRCVGDVVMPDHVHALIWLPETGQLSRFVYGWKRMSSFNIRK